MEVRAGRSGAGGAPVAAWAGTVPSSPVPWPVACTAGSGAGGSVRRLPDSSLVQSSTTGPPEPDVPSAPSANSYPPRAQRSVRHLRSVVRLPSITWKP